MEVLIRRYDSPPELPPDKVELLGSALQVLRQQQRDLADQAPAVAYAESARVSKDHLELHYAGPAQQNLYELIKSGLPDDDTLKQWAARLCAAFAAAYPAGQPPRLRHGGLCGWNVVVSGDQDIHILDFGVADCLAEVRAPADDFWVKQVAPGVAPEVWQSPARFDQRSDIFSLGVLLYELSCGQHPFGAIREEPEDCKYQMLIEVPVAPHRRNPDLDEQWSQAIHKAIRTEPAARFQTFAEMGRALEACRSTRAVPAPGKASVAAAPATTPAPQPTQEPTVAAPADTVDDEETQARREYLKEQARLKEAHQEAEQRMAEKRNRRQQQREKRRAQWQRTRAAIKQNAFTLVAVVLGIAGVGLVSSVLWVRMGHTRRRRSAGAGAAHRSPGHDPAQRAGRPAQGGPRIGVPLRGPGL
jgi:hypothetical protein